MRYDVHLKTSCIAKSIHFYVNETGLFIISHDYGMGNVLLKNANNSSFCLLLKEHENFINNNSNPLFSIGVDDCLFIYNKFRAIKFDGSAGIVSFNDGRDSFVDYPLGKNFMVEDPDGNRFLISQWHENAL